ncbi:acyl-CoA dehydrogenase family protein [Streptomyces sp. NPDC088400]
MQRKHYDEEHLALAKAFRAFIDKIIVPHFGDWERAGLIPREVFAVAG